MDGVIDTVIALSMLLFPILFTGATIYRSLTKRSRQLGRLRREASRLGLEHSAEHIWGVLDGQRVLFQCQTRGTGQHRRTESVAMALLHPPLDLGLSVQTRGFPQQFLAVVTRTRSIELAHPELDATFRTEGDEPERVATLLTPELRAFLLATQAVAHNLELNDQALVMARRTRVPDPEWTESALRTVARGAALVAAARDEVPIATPLAPHYEAWSSFARAHGLHGITTPLAMWGEIEGSQVTVSAARTGHLEYVAQVLVHFPAPLRCGLVVRPRGTLDAMASIFSGHDTATGDPRFDDAFVVSSTDPRQIRQLLDQSVRATLLSIAREVGPVVVQDAGVAVTTAEFPAQPALVPRLVDALEGVVQAIQANAQPDDSKHKGPYR